MRVIIRKDNPVRRSSRLQDRLNRLIRFRRCVQGCSESSSSSVPAPPHWTARVAFVFVTVVNVVTFALAVRTDPHEPATALRLADRNTLLNYQYRRTS